MIAYKGFDKDLKCRGFQFEVGKEYEEDKAELCNCGFHACENPLDCFRYYSPNKSVYHEVEIEDNGERQENSKVVGKKIKIGAKLDVAKICKLHFEYVKERTTNTEQGKDYASLSAQDYSSLSARNRSSLSAQDYSSLSARNRSSLSARHYSSLSAQDYSSLSAQSYSSLSAQDYSSLSARSCSSLSAQSGSSLSAQDGSSLSARNYSSLSARNYSSLSARNYSSLSVRSCSSLSAQDYSSLSGGKDCVIAAFNSKAKADIGSIIALANRKWVGNEYKITDFKAVVVDGEKIKANVWYELKNGEFVEVENN